MSFRKSAAYARAMAENRPSIALVTGARSGIGLAMARKIASFPFVDKVLAVSRSITEDEATAISPKALPVAADIGTEEGRRKIMEQVTNLCGNPHERKRQLRFLIHSAGTIDPIKNVLQVTPEELRHAMNINCESPFLLTTSLYPFMTPLDDNSSSSGVAGRILHVSSGAAHGAPAAGWGVYGISKAAFFQSFKVFEKEFRETLGGKVVVGSFRPGVVDTCMQGKIRESSTEAMPLVQKFKDMKEKAASMGGVGAGERPRPPPQGALDTPENVAFFGEFLLLGTTDEEFANKDAPLEYDIRDKDLFSKWISPEDLE